MSGGSNHPVAGRTDGRARWRRLAVPTVIGIVASALVFAAPRFVPNAAAAGATFVIDSTGDEPDWSSGDGVCAISDLPDAPCTLRAAIKQANASPGHDVIEFDIPGAGVHTIRPASRLPILTDQAGVTIDGYTQGDARPNALDHGTDAVIRIQIEGPGQNVSDPDGDGAPAVDGLFVRSSDNVIRGLAVYGFNKPIRIYGDDPSTSSDDIDGAVAYNEVVGNFIGTNAAGTYGATVRVIGADAVHLQHGATANRIGMPGNANRNVISGAADRGVGLYDPGTDFNLIQNNIIGLAPTASGLTARPNINHGVDINDGSSRNTVGGWNTGEGNVISGNGRTGVEISHSLPTTDTQQNLVVGNLIGTNAAGSGASSATANGEYGIYFEGHALCPEPGVSPARCSPDIKLNLAAGNVIIGSQSGIVVSKGAHDNSVIGNWIGVLRNGTDPFGGTPPTTLQQGVSIEMGAFDNLIEANTIANSQRGIHATPKDPKCPAAGTIGGDACRAAEFPVFGNTFSMNSITNTSLQAIELRSKGQSSYSEGPGVSAEVNGGIAAPVVVDSGPDAASTDSVVVQTCSRCWVELFVTPDVSGVAWPEFGRAQRFLRSTTADAAGRAVFVLRDDAGDAMVVLAGLAEGVTATATDAAGNTSELSVRVPVVAGSIRPPSSTTTTIPATTTTTVLPSSTTTSSVPTTTVSARPVDRPATASDLAIRCRRTTAC